MIMVSHYLDFIVPRCARLMSDYAKQRHEMMYHGLQGDAAIDQVISLAEQIENLLHEIAWYTAQNYRPSDPLPIDIVMELEARKLI